jgi:hypothetical protein
VQDGNAHRAYGDLQDQAKSQAGQEIAHALASRVAAIGCLADPPRSREKGFSSCHTAIFPLAVRYGRGV